MVVIVPMIGIVEYVVVVAGLIGVLIKHHGAVAIAIFAGGRQRRSIGAVVGIVVPFALGRRSAGRWRR